jgi:hypothetical protein
MKDYDFAEVNMTAIDLDEEVDKFTVEIILQRRGGVLNFMWDKTSAVVAFEILK